jgi:hypothetical protein
MIRKVSISKRGILNHLIIILTNRVDGRNFTYENQTTINLVGSKYVWLGVNAPLNTATGEQLDELYGTHNTLRDVEGFVYIASDNIDPQDPNFIRFNETWSAMSLENSNRYFKHREFHLSKTLICQKDISILEIFRHHLQSKATIA